MIGILTTDDSFTQLHGDRDEVEGGTSAEKVDARDDHGVQGIEFSLFALLVVELKDAYSLCDDLSICVGGFSVPNDHHEESDWIGGQTHVATSSANGFAANGERNCEKLAYKGLEAQELQCPSDEQVDEILFGGSSG